MRSKFIAFWPYSARVTMVYRSIYGQSVNIKGNNEQCRGQRQYKHFSKLHIISYVIKDTEVRVKLTIFSIDLSSEIPLCSLIPVFLYNSNNLFLYFYTTSQLFIEYERVCHVFLSGNLVSLMSSVRNNIPHHLSRAAYKTPCQLSALLTYNEACSC